MTNIKLTVSGAKATAIVDGVLTSGSVGIPVTIEYDSIWDGLTKNLVCTNGKWRPTGTPRAILNIGGSASVAPEAMIADGHLYLGIEGRNADGTLVICTTWADCGTVFAGADTDADPSTQQSPSAWDQLQAEIDQLKNLTVSDAQIETALDLYFERNPIKIPDDPENVCPLTTEQIHSIDSIFKICSYTNPDIAAEYATFREAFGLGNSEDNSGETVTAYTVTNDLTDVTSNNSATKVTEGDFYSATLSAEDGYNIAVTITMGGEDITADVYTEDGTILITEVTGDIVITATAELASAPVLYQLANTPRTVNADLFEDTGLTFGSSTANGYTKAWTMVARVKNMTSGALWCVNGQKSALASVYENRWNNDAGNKVAHLTTYICSTISRPSITSEDPDTICIVITHAAMVEKTATVYYLNYAGEMTNEELVGINGKFNAGDTYAGNMMVGGATAADFVGTIEEFTIYEGVATEDQIKSYLGVS